MPSALRVVLGGSWFDGLIFLLEGRAGLGLNASDFTRDGSGNSTRKGPVLDASCRNRGHGGPNSISVHVAVSGVKSSCRW